jgi:Cu+-exporting ATPase
MCAMLITFIIFGKFLEAMAKGRTSAALAALTRLSPATALLIKQDSAGHVVTEEEVPTALLQRGDLLKVRCLFS